VRFDIDEAALVPFFTAIGPVTHCKVIRDSRTGESKGWGFVTFSDPLHATTALRSLNGLLVGGRPIVLDEATSLSRRRKERLAREGFERREAKRQAKRQAEDAAAARQPGLEARSDPKTEAPAADEPPPNEPKGFGEYV